MEVVSIFKVEEAFLENLLVRIPIAYIEEPEKIVFAGVLHHVLLEPVDEALNFEELDDGEIV